MSTKKPAAPKSAQAGTDTLDRGNTNAKLDSLEKFRSDATEQALRTHQGVKVSDSIVHARGTGAHGYFQTYENHSVLTKAGFLQDPGKKTPVFTRFSAVQGPRGSGDTVRDVRGFAVKFFTDEGNFDLVGNNMPVFFIQDAITFPDFVHAVKPEPHNEIAAGGSAHDTFWDFVSLVPESAHMVIWTMSDRAIPKSLRNMQGFGVHTFRLVNAEGKSRYVKFHWRPTAGTCSLVWDEAQKLAGKDSDFHRRDLWESIEMGDYPEWELGVQIIEKEKEHTCDFDILDPTKLIPEELVPITPLGKMVLNRNPDNFFAETEQVAFSPGNIVPGIDFSNDGGWQNETAPAAQDGGFESYPERIDANKIRQRSESFSDHFSQARLFFHSMSKHEQEHIIAAYSFELGKVAREFIRARQVNEILANIDLELAKRVAQNLGLPAPEAGTVDVRKSSLNRSPALSQANLLPADIKTRKVAILAANGVDGAAINAMKKALMAEGAHAKLLGSTSAPVTTAQGKALLVDASMEGLPSVAFDAVFVPGGAASIKALSTDGVALHYVLEAYKHLKAIALHGEAKQLLDVLKLEADAGLIVEADAKLIKPFIAAIGQHRVWEREPKAKAIAA
jgi:catalase